jgi:hypothetical protein
MNSSPAHPGECAQSKLIACLAAILGGCPNLQDISRGVCPLERDQTVADAWANWAEQTTVGLPGRGLNAA